MKNSRDKHLFRFTLNYIPIIVLLSLLLPSKSCLATAYNYPGPPNTPPIPLTMSNGDSLTVTSGNMQGTSGGFTVTTNALGFVSYSITINSGATLSYSGSGIPLLPAGNGHPAYTININGVLSAPTNTSDALKDTNIGPDNSFNVSITGASAGNGVVNGNLNFSQDSDAFVAINIDGAFAQVNGNILNVPSQNEGQMNFGSNSPVNFTTNGNISDFNSITLSSGTFTLASSNTIIRGTMLEIANGATGIFNGPADFSFTTVPLPIVSIDNGGTMFIGAAGSISTVTFNNAGNLNIGSTFTLANYNTFNNSGGALYLLGSGAIVGNLTTGTLLSIGQDSNGIQTGNLCNFTTQGTIDSIPIIHVYNGSLTATTGNTITNVNTSFTVDAGSTVTLAATLSGSGTFSNSGTVNLNTGGSIATTGTFSNSGTLNANVAFSTTGFPGTPTNTSTGKININGVTMTINSSFANNGGLFVYNSGGQISGALAGTGSLTIGADSLANSHAITFTAQNTIAATTINVISGSSLTTSGVNTISGVSGGLNIGTSGTPGGVATLNATYTGTGPVTNYGALNIGNTFTSGAIANNAGLYAINSAVISAAITGGTGSSFNVGQDSTGASHPCAFTASNTISSATINVYNGSSLTTSGVNSISGVNTAFNIGTSGSPGGTVTLNATYNGSGPVTNYGALNIGNTFTSGNIANNAGIYAINSATISAAITGTAGSSFTVGQTSTGGAASSTFVTSNTIDSVPIISVVNGSFTNNNNVTNVNTSFTISNGAGATFNAQISGSGTFTNGTSSISIGTAGTFGMTGTLSNAGTITNNGSMALVQTVTGGGSITNSGTGTLTLSTGANVGNPITNQASGILTVLNSAQSAAITNAGALTINPGATLTATGTIANTGSIQVNGNISMPGQALNTTSPGSITLPAGSTITAGSYANTGTHSTTITAVGTSGVGTVTTTGGIDLTNTQIYVSSTLTQSGTWTLFSAGTALTPPLSPTSQVHLPSSSGGLFTNWTYNFTPKTMTVSLAGGNIYPLAIGPINQAIANVLDEMNADVTNSGQQALLNAVFATTTQEQLNQLLHELMPNNNANAINVEMQNAALNKTLSRVAARRELFASEMNDGIASGDVTSNTSFWQTLFGSIAKQQPAKTAMNQGYKAKSGGLLLGLDTKCDNDDVYGIAAGASYTRVTESSNTNFLTDITGYHALLYGSNGFQGDLFIDWLFNGAINDNSGSRYINVGTGNLSVTSSFRGWLAGVVVNFGKFFDINDILRVSQVNLLNYTYLYRPAYNETGSVAALHVANSANKNLLTVGSGFRVSMPGENAWLTGSREIRAMVTYDAINPGDTVTANFLVGSNNFIITSHTVRTALQLGIDFTFDICECAQLQFSYDFELRDGYHDNSGSIKFRYLFG